MTRATPRYVNTVLRILRRETDIAARINREQIPEHYLQRLAESHVVEVESEGCRPIHVPHVAAVRARREYQELFEEKTP